MERVITISTNKLFHTNCEKKLQANKVINLYSEEEINSFDFKSSDIVLFDMLINYNVDLLLLKAEVLCLDEDTNALKGYRLLKRGAKGYDNIGFQTLDEAIRSIKNGKVWMYPELMSFIIKNSTISTYTVEDEAISKLTPKELEVAKLVSQGLTNNEIAQELKITLRTVKAHVGASFSKLNLKDRVSLAMYIKEYNS